MALQMTRPTKSPRSGTYLVRMAIPADLRATAQQLYGVRAELRENLGTKDAREAARLCPAALGRLYVRLEALAQHKARVGREPTDQDIAAMAGEIYSGLVEAQGGNVGTPDIWLEQLDHLDDQRTPINDEGDYVITPSKSDLGIASAMLVDGGWTGQAGDIKKLAKGITTARALFAQLMLRKSRGNWSPDEYVGTFPTARPKAILPAAAEPECSFDSLLKAWARERGCPDITARPIDRTIYDRVRTVARLAAFLPDRNATTLNKADTVRWKESMQNLGRKVPTIRNDLSEMSAIWTWGIRNGKLPEGPNPFAGISPAKLKSRRRERRAFTDEEARAILTEARNNTGFMRWLPWVCCLTGARLTEVCQSVRGDVVKMDGIWVLRIHDEGTEDDAPRTIKNEDSRRNIPLHPALIAEGFLAYVLALPAQSPLFPDARPDATFGLRSVNAGRRIGRWLKVTLNIRDTQISPNHSWRHWFIEAARRTQMHTEVRSALTGHSARLDESAQYGAGMGSFVKVLHDALALVPPPVLTNPEQVPGVPRNPIGDSQPPPGTTPAENPWRGCVEPL